MDGDPIELFLFHIGVMVHVYQMEFFWELFLFLFYGSRVALNVSWSQSVI